MRGAGLGRGGWGAVFVLENPSCATRRAAPSPDLGKGGRSTPWATLGT